MNSQISFLRRAAMGLLLLALLLPACATVEPPQATGTPQVVTTEPGDGYPPPPPTFVSPPLSYLPPSTQQAWPTRTGAQAIIPGELQTPPPPTLHAWLTPTPTTTPWPARALPALQGYTAPGPFSGMRALYSGQQGYYTIDLDSMTSFSLPPPLSDWAQASPQGNMFLYSRWYDLFFTNDPGDKLSIWAVNLDGSQRQLLVNATLEWYPANPVWSPDGSQIAYVRGYLRKPYTEGLWIDHRELGVMDADGSNQRLVTAHPDFVLEGFGGHFLFFRWMHNGYIYFVNGYDQLYAVDPQGGTMYRLMDSVDPLALRLALAPDGQHATSFGDLSALQQAGLTVVDLPGSPVGWSPGSDRVIYLDGYDLWLREVATGADRLLLPGVSSSIQVHGFSPDGRFIAYQTYDGLFVLDVEIADSQPRLVVADPHSSAANAWSIRFIDWIPVP